MEPREIEQFLYREARYMDDGDYDKWLGLWLDEATYWVPSNDEAGDPTQTVSVIYDDHARLEERVYRLTHPGGHSQDPPSRVRRIVSNIEIESGGDIGGDIRVLSNFVLVETRRGVQTVYAAKVEHGLVERDGDLRIRSKKVVLTALDDPLGNLTFLL